MHGIIFGQFDNFSVYPSIHVLPLIHVSCRNAAACPSCGGMKVRVHLDI